MDSSGTYANAALVLMVLETRMLNPFQTKLLIIWSSAIKALREAFIQKLPPHLFFRKMFIREQSSNEGIEVLVCGIRALLLELLYELTVQAKLDKIFSLLHKRIRKRLTRTTINNFNQLLNNAREIEESLRECPMIAFNKDEQVTEKTLKT